MHCDTTRAALLDYANGELSSLQAWAVRRHLAACADCRAALASLQAFTNTLRRADLVPPEPAVAFQPRRTPPRRRVLAVAAALGTVCVLLLLPALYQNHRAAQNPGAAVAAALGRVNTWHFSGWKLIDGQKVPWEVWGRRAPWLYYERVGDVTSWSDGKQVVRVYPPNAALNRLQGLVIKTTWDQTPGGGFFADPAYQTLAAVQPTRTSFGDGFTKLYAQTVAEAQFREQYPEGVGAGVNANKLYVISKRDWLPTTYQLHYDSKTFARDTEFLTVRYGMDLPKTVLAPPTASGCAVVDLSPSAPPSSIFRVTADPVAMDKSGNLVIAARGWLGENRLRPGSQFSLDVQPYNGTFTATRRGRPIKYLYATSISLLPAADILMPFAPLEPSEVASGLPDKFSLSMQATPQLRVRGADVVVSDGTLRPLIYSENLLVKQFTWRLSLPKPVATLPVKFPSAINLAEVRSRYYFFGYDYKYTALKQIAPWLIQAGGINPNGTVGVLRPDGVTNIDMKLVNAANAIEKHHPAVFLADKHKFRARAAYWQAQKLALMSQGEALDWQRGNRRVHYAYGLQDLARLYQLAGDTAKRNHTLRRLLALTQGDASLGLLHKQAAYTLQTGSFPDDPGYKGP